MRLLYAVALLLLATAAHAQDGTCSSVADIEASGPVESIPPDAPIFAPLRWGMSRAQARQALISDGWQSRSTEESFSVFNGEMFDHDTSLYLQFGSSGRLIQVGVMISQEDSFYWNDTIWDEVRPVLEQGYGPPSESQHHPSGSSSCQSFEPGGQSQVSATWPTLKAEVTYGCMVVVWYRGPGLPEARREASLVEARDADRTCRAEVARLRRDRGRLAPLDSTASLPLPPRVARRVPAPGSPATTSAPPATAEGTYDMAEVQPELIGGLPALQASITYPDFERRAGVQGRVIVAFVVDENGRPTSVSVARGVSPGLDRAAVQAIQNARFNPGQIGGRPVRVRFTLPIDFTLR